MITIVETRYDVHVEDTGERIRHDIFKQRVRNFRSPKKAFNYVNNLNKGALSSSFTPFKYKCLPGGDHFEIEFKRADLIGESIYVINCFYNGAIGEIFSGMLWSSSTFEDDRWYPKEDI